MLGTQENPLWIHAFELIGNDMSPFENLARIKLHSMLKGSIWKRSCIIFYLVILMSEFVAIYATEVGSRPVK